MQQISSTLCARLRARHWDPAVSKTDHPCPWRAPILGDKVDMKGDVCGFSREKVNMIYIDIYQRRSSVGIGSLNYGA